MGKDEMTARIAVLEAMVLQFAEMVVRDLHKKDDQAAIDGLFFSLGKTGGDRYRAMPEPMKRIAHAHHAAMVNALAAITNPHAERPKN